MSDLRGYGVRQRRAKNLSRLQRIIREKGPITNAELKQYLDVSDPTLSGYLTRLENRGLIEHIEGEDRRRKLYRIKLGSESAVESNLRKVDAIEFIENIETPVYSFESSEDEQTTVTVLISALARQEGIPEAIEKIKQNMWQQQAHNIARSWMPIAKKSLIHPGTKPGLKVAVILTAES